MCIRDRACHAPVLIIKEELPSETLRHSSSVQILFSRPFPFFLWPFLRWTATTVVSLVILLINVTSPRRISSRARKKMTTMMKRRKRNSSRGRMGSKRGSTKRKMERHILLVTGSLTLSHQVDLLQVKKKWWKSCRHRWELLFTTTIAIIDFSPMPHG